MSGNLIPNPSALIMFSAGSIRVFAERAHASERVLELWQAARIDADKGRRHSVNLPFPTQPRYLAQSTREDDIADSATDRRNERERVCVCVKTDIDLTIDFGIIGHMGRIRTMADSEVSPEKMLRFSIRARVSTLFAKRAGRLIPLRPEFRVAYRCAIYYRPITVSLKQID